MGMLEYNNGKWKTTDRLLLWQSEAPLLTDDLVDKFADLAIRVLKESDPEINLPQEKRIAAKILGYERKFSDRLRRGMAETLALLGARSDELKTCTAGKGEAVAFKVVQELLNTKRSISWISLNPILPLLAEASPEAFLTAAESAINSPNDTFNDVFKEESGGVFGRIYTSGLLWALENLAWSSEYLVRAYSILADLASIDPGGNWSNRPINSLITILLPWVPQTYAPTEVRHNALICISKSQPEIAWKVVLELLPKHHGTSFPSSKPKYRNEKPVDWTERPSRKQRLEDEAYCGRLALDLAGHDPDRLVKLLQFYFLLHPKFSNFAKGLRDRIRSNEIKSLPESKRLELWVAITNKTSNHRKYSESEAWKVPEEALSELDTIADSLKPERPEIRHKRLFCGRDIDLYDERGDWEKQRSLLSKRRCEAVKEILSKEGFPTLKRFIESVEAPHEVGNAYARLPDLLDDRAILPGFLISDNKSLQRFTESYAWIRYHDERTGWLDDLGLNRWNNLEKIRLFSILPFNKEVWERAEKELGNDRLEYWERVNVRAIRDSEIDYTYALEKLLQANRSDSVIDSIWMCELWGAEYTEYSLKALEQLTASHQIDTHGIGEIFEHLQKSEGVSESRLSTLEYKYLEIFGEHRRLQPKTLYRILSEQPNLFCEFIRSVYKSKDGKTTDSQSKEDNSKNAERIYRLLSDWNHPPGLNRNGEFEAEKMLSWIETVKKSCLETGHWEVAANQIGEVLIHSPKGENDLWIDSVCEVLDSKDDDEFRRGARVAIFNSRGAHFDSGGAEENQLAEKWSRIAVAAESKGFVRLGTTLRGLSKTYKEDARRSAEYRPDLD